MLEYDRIRLKQAARQAMKAQRPHPMLVTFVFAAIGGIGGQILTQILGMVTGSTSLNTQYFQAVWEYGDTDTSLQYILMAYGPQRLIFALLGGGGLSTLLVALWQGLMRVGYSGFCLDMARRRQPQLETLFRAFPQAGSVLLTQLLVFVFRFLWGCLLGVGAFVLISVIAMIFFSAPFLALPLILCVYIALLLGILWVTLRYELVDFLIADQGLTGMDAIRESKRLMQGNYGRLFTLKLSFFGWYLLEIGVILAFLITGLLTFGLQLANAADSSDALVALIVSALGFLALFGLACIALSFSTCGSPPTSPGRRPCSTTGPRAPTAPCPPPAAGTAAGASPPRPGQTPPTPGTPPPARARARASAPAPIPAPGTAARPSPPDPPRTIPGIDP